MANDIPTSSTQPLHRAPRVFSIPPGVSFLRTLASSIVDGKIIEGFVPRDDPSLLPSATIYVPTRRAARMLAAEFIHILDNKAVLLPSIRTLGDSDEDEVFFQSPPSGVLDIPEMIHPLERQLELANLVRAWTTQLSKTTSEFYGDEELVIPASTSDAIAMAKSLSELIDQLETEEVSRNAVAGLMGEDYSEWWQLTLPFLKIVLDAWPQHLKDRDKVDPATARRMLLNARADLIRNSPPKGPIIAAGSTGSIPATAQFLKAIVQSPNGAVVLPGLDQYLSNDVWSLFKDDKPEETNPGLEAHPQYSLNRLCSTLGVLPQDVELLGSPSSDLSTREKLVSQALLPAEETQNWHAQASTLSNTERQSASKNIVSIIAQNEREEALAIAIAMREVLTDDEKTAALVTPDRNLARRVSSELLRFGIEINDSGGTPLRNTQAAIFMRLCLDCLITSIATNSPIDPILFVSLAKHPLLRLGLDEEAISRVGLLVEHALVRGRHARLYCGGFEQAARDARAYWVKIKYASKPVKAITEDDWEILTEWCHRLDKATQSVAGSFNSETSDIRQLCSAFLSLVQQLAVDHQDMDTFFQTEGGLELTAFLEDLSQNLNADLDLSPSEFPACLTTLLGDRVVRNAGLTHPRLHILGPLEARLQQYDLTILGSLTEATWPQVPRNDPFLNRPMKMGIGMAAPERRIGLSAHDFQQLMGGQHVILTRSERVEDTPSIASRWVQRFETVIGKDETEAMVARGETYLRYARTIDQSIEVATRIKRPNPTPDVEHRPTMLSVTDIETWLRDPYALYARKILSLQKLPELVQEADPATKGTLYHDVLNEYVAQGHYPAAPGALETLMGLFDVHHAKLNLGEATTLIWRPRFEEIAQLYLEWECERHASIKSSATEISGQIKLCDGSFTLRARADRIDKLTTGEISILDYKTGTKPSTKEALTLSPQLTLEGAIAAAGGFESISPSDIASLEYVRLRLAKSLKVDNISKNPMQDVEKARDDLEHHVQAYQNKQQGYISRYAVQQEAQMSGDYDHLARVREWSIGDDEDGGGSDV